MHKRLQHVAAGCIHLLVTVHSNQRGHRGTFRNSSPEWAVYTGSAMTSQPDATSRALVGDALAFS